MTINDRDFLRLVDFMRSTYGINLEHKRQLIDARLSFDIARRGYPNFTVYVERVIADPSGEECRHMVNRLSTNYTFFFREPDYIDALCGTVLPDFLSRGKTHLRIWCAACSSGQEVYSVGMVLEYQKRVYGKPVSYEIVGTDINTEMLGIAISGVYPEEELNQIPTRYRPFICQHTDRTFSVDAEICRQMTWRDENLLDAVPPVGGYDIVFCRNVMIYFTQSLRHDMAKRLSAALCPAGYLFTGATESIDLERKYFRYIAPTFYQKAGTRR